MSLVNYPITVYLVDQCGRISPIRFDNENQIGGCAYIKNNKFVIRHAELYDDNFQYFFLSLTDAKESANMIIANCLNAAKQEVKIYKQILKDNSKL